MYHNPVLLSECIDGLNINPDGIYVDATAGGAGHSSKILERLSEQGRLICMDQDPDAIQIIKERIGSDPRVTVVHDNFAHIAEALSDLGIDRVDGHCEEYRKKSGQRLIVSYSESRAKKNAHNREKGVARLQKAYAKGTLTKDKVHKRGYNKFLDISKEVTVSINYDKVKEDALWDGLKGYITNTDLDSVEVIKQYHGLWVVERAFRIGKSSLEMRPIFHFTPKRIEAHICICFVAYKVYKELERTIRELGIGMSVDKALFYARTITTLKIRLPNGELYTETLYNTPQQMALRPLIEDCSHAPA
jgi:hypothetical protein